jgi:hypothetical protein
LEISAVSSTQEVVKMVIQVTVAYLTARNFI